MECDFFKGIKLLARDAVRQGTSSEGRAPRACPKHARKSRKIIIK